MKPKSIILLVLALGCGLVASLGINQVMANRGENTDGETQEIVVVVAEVNANDPIPVEALKLENWPKETIPLGALLTLEEATGRRTRSKFFAGEPVLEAKLLAKGASGGNVSDNIPKGHRVIAVRVDDVSSTGGVILPGDRVDLLVHLRKDSSPGMEETTKTFLQNVKVFAVNDVTARSGDEEKITARTVSFLVTPEQAEVVTLAESMGKIRLVLRGPSDKLTEPTEGAEANKLFTNMPNKGSETVAQPSTNPLLEMIQQPVAPKPTDVVVVEPKSFKMVILMGANRSEVEFAEDGTPTSTVDPIPTEPEETAPALETEEVKEEEEKASDTVDG